MQTFNGMPVTITEDAMAALPEDKWDWSRYRSPSRARRRRDRRKVIKREPAAFQMQGRLIIHPRLWSELRRVTS